MKIQNNQTQVDTFRAKRIGGLKVVVTSVSDTNNQYAVPDLTKVQLKASYRFAGKQVTIANTQLLLLAVYSSLRSPRIQLVHPNYNLSVTKIEKDTSVKGVQVKVFDIYFGSPIDCSSENELELSATSTSVWTAGGSTYGDTSNSSITIEPFYTYEPMIGVPQIDVKTVQASESNNTYSFGSNVAFSAFVNLDKKSNAPVISSLSLSSNQLNESYTSDQLYNLSLSKLGRSIAIDFSSATPANLYNSPIILANDGILYNNVSYDVSFNSSNVNAGQNFFMATTLTCTPEILRKAQMVKQELSQDFQNHIQSL